jgi:hypothetical protein
VGESAILCLFKESHTNRRASWIISLLILVVCQACLGSPVPGPASPTADIDAIVAATLTAAAGGGSDGPGELTPEPPLPACVPAHPGAQNLPLPAGIASGKAPAGVTLTNPMGLPLASRTVPGISWLDADQVHPAGGLSIGAADLPLVYFSLESSGKIKQNAGASTSDLLLRLNLLSLIGAEGQPYLSFVTMDMAGGWTNQLYAGRLADLPGLQPRLTWTPPQQASYGNAIQPLRVHFAAGDGQGVWFTYTMEGIGNINFPPLNGLYYLDLATNSPVEFLPTTDALGGMSPDQTLIAYGPGQGGAPGVIFNGFTVKNLLTCGEKFIAFNPASNLGGGYMVFSPDNQLVAWVEASGPNNMEAQFRLRVARTDGTSLFDAPAAGLSGFLAGETPGWLVPAGWLDNHLLLLEIYSQAANQYVLVVWAPDPARPLDPALGANQSAPLADGPFLGFVYP